MQLPEEIHELIVAELTKELDREGREKLEVWFKKEESNREVYKELCTLWYSGKWGLSRMGIKKREAWEQVVKKRRVRRKTRVMVWGALVAASIVLIVGMFGLFHLKDERLPVALLSEWKPRDVTLILSNGELRSLKTLASDTIEEKGVVIRSDSAYLEYRNTMEEQVAEGIVYNELIVPKGGEYRLRLVDGSLVIVNSESKLRYPVSFNGDNREVFLSGEACFEVTRDSLKPFVVRAEQAAVQVLGTLFNMSAYTDEDNMEVTLVKGSVQVVTGEERKLLRPNEQWLLDYQTRQQIIRDVDARSYIAWTSGLFRFDAMPLEQLMLKLSRWFDICYEFGDDSLKEVRYSGGFRKYDNVSDILGMIGEITNVSFTIVNGVIRIDKKSDSATNTTR